MLDARNGKATSSVASHFEAVATGFSPALSGVRNNLVSENNDNTSVAATGATEWSSRPHRRRQLEVRLPNHG